MSELLHRVWIREGHGWIIALAASEFFCPLQKECPPENMAVAATASRQVASKQKVTRGTRHAGFKRTRAELLAEEMEEYTKRDDLLTPMDDLTRRLYTVAEEGEGTYFDPHKVTLRDKPNLSACIYCPVAKCCCRLFESLLEETFESLQSKIVLEVAGQKHMCAKSILPVFVSRLAAILDIKQGDTFFDLGSGNGSVLFQIAFMTGVPCVGVELSAHNAQVSREAWKLLKPKLELLSGRHMPEVTIVTGDLCKYLSGTLLNPDGSQFTPSANTKIWASSKLMPQEVLHYMGTYFIAKLPIGAQVVSLADLYPHGRTIARVLHPDWFELMHMTDYEWTLGSVEWTAAYIEKFHRYIKQAL